MPRPRKPRPSNNPKGRPSTGLREASKLVTGPAELFRAMDARAEERGIKAAEAWRRAARTWLDQRP